MKKLLVIPAGFLYPKSEDGLKRARDGMEFGEDSSDG
jgi:hypothetical protein